MRSGLRLLHVTMVFDFDLRLFCENLKATKPPYECPAPGCGRVYKTYIGIQFHLFNYDHDNPDGKSSSTPGNGDGSKQQDGSRKGHHRQVLHGSSPGRVGQDESEHEQSSSCLSPHNVSAKSQRIVEVTLDGRVHRIDVYEPMNVTVRQSQTPTSSTDVDNKPSEVVACSTLSSKAVAAEPPPGDAMIGDTAPVVDATGAWSSFTDDAVATAVTAELSQMASVTGELLETTSNHCIADVLTETAVESDSEKVKISFVDKGCNDVVNSDVSNGTLSAGSGIFGSVPLSECSPDDSGAVKSNTSVPYDAVIQNAFVNEMKTKASKEEFVKPLVECVEKDTVCCDDDTTILLSTSELVPTGIVSTPCVKATECDTVKSGNLESTSTDVNSKSAPTKITLPSAEFKILEDYVRPPKVAATAQTAAYYKFTEKTSEELDAVVEYDMDEEVKCCCLSFNQSINQFIYFRPHGSIVNRGQGTGR